jgi:hypothetical protein
LKHDDKVVGGGGEQSECAVSQGDFGM